ncbi:MAG: glutathione S-transferase family protein, partial [Candidatus Dadabacteria bacterium]
YAFVDFGACVGQAVPSELANLQAWMQRMAQRPSAEASLHPAASASGMRG